MRSLFNFLKRLLTPPKKHRKKRKRRIFLASDLHLDHKNIIRYCHRPFHSVKQMNGRLIRNWNRTVRRNDIVYFLGDLAKNTDYWRRRLKGKIIFIKGNHDRPKRTKVYRKKYLTYKGITFLLVHNPYDIPKTWKGWVIHGHKHNNDVKKFPLIKKRSKRINVSCELIKYRPISIEVLYQKIRKRE